MRGVRRDLSSRCGGSLQRGGVEIMVRGKGIAKRLIMPRRVLMHLPEY